MSCTPITAASTSSSTIVSALAVLIAVSWLQPIKTTAMASPYWRVQLGQGRGGYAGHAILSGEHLVHHRLQRRGDLNRHGWRSGLCGPTSLYGYKRSAPARQE